MYLRMIGTSSDALKGVIRKYARFQKYLFCSVGVQSFDLDFRMSRHPRIITIHLSTHLAEIILFIFFIYKFIPNKAFVCNNLCFHLV